MTRQNKLVLFVLNKYNFLISVMKLLFFYFQMVVGNFEPNLISTRCTAFETLLQLISNESRLRDCPAAITFFQDIELIEARKLIEEKKFDQALSVLETSFRLLNKVNIILFTGRSFRFIV